MRPVSLIARDTLQAGNDTFRIGHSVPLLDAEQEALNNVRQAYLDFRNAQTEIYSAVHLMEHEYDVALQDQFFEHRDSHRNLNNAQNDVIMMILRRLDAPIPIALHLETDPPTVSVRAPTSADHLVVNRELIANATGFNKHIGEARALAYAMMHTPSLRDIELDHSAWLVNKTPYVQCAVRSAFHQPRADQLTDAFDEAMVDALTVLLNDGGVATMLAQNQSENPNNYSFPHTAIVLNDEIARVVNIEPLFISPETSGASMLERQMNALLPHLVDVRASLFAVVRMTSLVNPENQDEKVPGFLVTVVTRNGDVTAVSGRGYSITLANGENNDIKGTVETKFKYSNNGTLANDSVFSGVMDAAAALRASQPTDEVEATPVEAEPTS